MVTFISLTDGTEYEMPKGIQASGWFGTPTPTVRRDEDMEGPKNTYWLFAGHDYYPRGGVSDFVGTFDTVGEAKEAFDRLEDNDWGHIVTVTNEGFNIVIETYEELEDGVKYYGWRRPR